MDFFKKAKKDAEKVLEDAKKNADNINKMMSKINIGDKPPQQAPQPSPGSQLVADPSSTPKQAVSSASPVTMPPTIVPVAAAPAGTALTAGQPTSGSSTVPHSTHVEAPKKMPLAARKSVRDKFEDQKGSLEEELSKLLATPWTINVDTAAVFSYSNESMIEGARDDPGNVYFTYFQMNMIELRAFVRDFGDDGRAQLNRLAYAHTWTLEPAPEPKRFNTDNFVGAGCDIHEGRLRIIFNPAALGAWSQDAMKDLAKMITDAEASSITNSNAGPALNLAARKSVRAQWDDQHTELLKELREWLKMPTLAFQPNFEANFAKMKTWIAAHPKHKQAIYYEDSKIGSQTMLYFEHLRTKMAEEGFEDDEMMQEGFKDVVAKNEIVFRVVDNIGDKSCRVVVDDGKLCMETTPERWEWNFPEVANDLVSLL